MALPEVDPTAGDNEASRLSLLARAGAASLRSATPEQRSLALGRCASEIRSSSGAILEANRTDVQEAVALGTAGALVDRLTLTAARVASMADVLDGLVAVDDPVGATVDGWTLPNGLSIRRVRVPLGVVGVIYEARPNVTAEAAGIAIRSANGIVLRGSSSASRSNSVIAAAMRRGLEAVGLSPHAVSLIEDTSRAAAVDFLHAPGIDCLIPRGGPSLLDTVRREAVMPVIIDGEGNCHIYVDASADLDQAAEIVANAKCSRPGVCNAAEKLLVHQAVADRFLPLVEERLVGVEIRADDRAGKVLSHSVAAKESDWAQEYLDLVIAVKVVDGIDEAISHIERYSSGHSEAICTTDLRAARHFVDTVDAAAVLVNTSTRFVDGAQLGLGGEIGISTQKLHARGPLGPEALTCVKLVIEGDGQVRP